MPASLFVPARGGLSLAAARLNSASVQGLPPRQAGLPHPPASVQGPPPADGCCALALPLAAGRRLPQPAASACSTLLPLAGRMLCNAPPPLALPRSAPALPATLRAAPAAASAAVAAAVCGASGAALPAAVGEPPGPAQPAKQAMHQTCPPRSSSSRREGSGRPWMNAWTLPPARHAQLRASHTSRWPRCGAALGGLDCVVWGRPCTGRPNDLAAGRCRRCLSIDGMA